jgi:predicted small metal-binding protein
MPVDGDVGPGYRAERDHFREDAMGRKYIDCREYPSDMHCTVTIAADSEDELLDVAAQHAVRTHGHEDSPELRAQLRQIIKTGAPPA